ncbi:MAG: fumarylacetoacetate hydrolase family protein, partial [Clostridia bacterium]|nr:fumarylacetoacetate hydrolase family protein [Clostridia bacterium]
KSFGEILVGPTTNQERNLPDVYGRWADGFNTILEKPVAAAWKDIKGKKMHLAVEGLGETEDNTDEYYCDFSETVEFITRYITMFPGDVITLGHTKNRILIPRDKVVDGMKISAGVDGIGEIFVTLKKSDAPDTFVPFNQLKL